MTPDPDEQIQERRMPVLLAVDDDPGTVAALERDLPRRFTADYRVVVERTPEAALRELRRLRDDGAEVALVIAGYHMAAMSGIDLLIETHRLHPDARRVLMIVYGDAARSDNDIAHARALGQIDCYITRPWASPEQWLYVTLTELLSEWAQTHLPTFEVVRLVGPRHSAESHHLRDLLNRNPVPYGFYADDSEEGKRLAQEYRLTPADLPAAIFADGRVLTRPSGSDIAEAHGVQTTCPAGLYDVAVIGAGPAGLAAAVYGASEGLRTAVLEREAVGGQAGTSSMIRNYLGFARGISGRALTLAAFQQTTAFGADIILMNSAVSLSHSGFHHVVGAADGSRITARAVVIAAGANYRRLSIPGVETLIGAGVFYGAGGSEAQGMRGRRVFVVGAGNSAGQAAIHLGKYASEVVILVRGASLEKSMSDYLIQEIADKPNIEVWLRTQVTGAHGTTSLEAIETRNSASGETSTEPADGLFLLIGAEPHTAWLPEEMERDERGYILTGHDLALDCGCGRNHHSAWPLEREPYLLETSVPGAFAAGDVRSGSMKRVASAVGEGATAISLIHQYLISGSQLRRSVHTGTAQIGERHGPMSGRRGSLD